MIRMMRLQAVAAAAAAAVASVAFADKAPSQVHLAYHECNGSECTYAVTWAEPGVSATTGRSVEYGETGTPKNTVGATYSTYTDGGWSGSLFNATFSVNQGVPFFYRACSGASACTSLYGPVRTPSVNVSYPLNVCWYADMGEMSANAGASNATMSALIAGTQHQDWEMVVHGGDIAYTSGTQSIWDNFMEEIEPIAAPQPYQVIPGNHEHYYNFSGYRHRFRMPGPDPVETSNLWHSYVYGPVRFVGFSTEHDYYQGSEQYAWLEATLEQAASERETTPWVVMYGHRPFYCSTDDWYDCVFHNQKMREELEGLLLKYQVDIYLAGHLHSYERMLPVYNSTYEKNYDNPKYTTHVVAGMAGDNEGLTDSWETQPPYSIVRTAQLGYTTLSFNSATEMVFNFILAESGKVYDTFTLTRNHGTSE